LSYTVELTAQARADLRRLEEFLEEAALKTGDWELPLRATETIASAFAILETHPYTCRKAAADPLERELVIHFGKSGYVALFFIEPNERVVVAAMRHQREDDRW
jgi:plasmid stabilization system protein ParE